MQITQDGTKTDFGVVSCDGADVLSFKNQRDRVGGDGFAPADAASPFIGRGLEPDLIRSNARGACQTLSHFAQGRRDLGLFGDEGCIDIANGPVAFGQIGGDALEEELRIYAGEFRISIRKVVTDIRQTRRAEQGVTNGVGERVGIGMAVQPERDVKRHSSQNHGAVRDDAMNVITVADAKICHDKVMVHESRDACLRTRYSNQSRSAGVVSLGLGSWFSRMATGWRKSSTAEASSVSLTPVLAARL